MIQLSACTFDIHVLEILGSLLINATVVMLQPYGNMDSVYFARTLQDKQITFMVAVPSFLTHFCDFIENSYDENPLSRIRSLCSGG